MLSLMFDALSLRSFSSLWYWIALIAFWLRAFGGVMGLSHGMVAQARGGDAALLEAAAQVQAHHRLAIWAHWQVPIVAGFALLLGGLTVLGVYGIELAAALWFIAVPYVILAALNLRMARRVVAENTQGAALLQLIFRFNIYAQLIGSAFIIITLGFGFIHMANAGFFR